MGHCADLQFPVPSLNAQKNLTEDSGTLQLTKNAKSNNSIVGYHLVSRRVKRKTQYPFKWIQLNGNVKIGQCYVKKFDNFNLIHSILEKLDLFNFHSIFFSLTCGIWTKIYIYIFKYTSKVEISQKNKTLKDF